MPKFSRLQKFTKENVEKVPQAKAVIYKVKDSGGQNLYTGIASRGRGQERLLEHRTVKSEKIPGGTRFQYAQVKNKDRARTAEEQIIRKEQPKFNKQSK